MAHVTRVAGAHLCMTAFALPHFHGLLAVAADPVFLVCREFRHSSDIGMAGRALEVLVNRVGEIDIVGLFLIREPGNLGVLFTVLRDKFVNFLFSGGFTTSRVGVTCVARFGGGKSYILTVFKKIMALGTVHALFCMYRVAKLNRLRFRAEKQLGENPPTNYQRADETEDEERNKSATT